MLGYNIANATKMLGHNIANVTNMLGHNIVNDTKMLGHNIINIKIKVVTNKNIFLAIFRFIFLNHFHQKKL